MTPEERAVIRAAMRLERVGSIADDDPRLARFRRAVQALKISRRPEHTVEPIPCMVFANNSATMFCVLPQGHDGSEPDKFGASRHAGYPGGKRGMGPNGGLRSFTHWPFWDTMEGHQRPACARFPGCERHS